MLKCYDAKMLKCKNAQNAQNAQKLEFLKLLKIQNSLPLAFKYPDRYRG